MKYTKLKKKEALKILEQNSNGILSVCCNEIPYSYPICYDTDSFCGCINLYFRIKKCSKLASILKNNNTVSITTATITNNNYWFGCSSEPINIIAIGEANLLEDNTDCCSKKDDCFINVEVVIIDIEGRIGCYNN